MASEMARHELNNEHKQFAVDLQIISEIENGNILEKEPRRNEYSPVMIEIEMRGGEHRIRVLDTFLTEICCCKVVIIYVGYLFV